MTLQDLESVAGGLAREADRLEREAARVRQKLAEANHQIRCLRSLLRADEPTPSTVLLSEPATPPAFRQAFDIWTAYYAETEAYDRAICTGPDHEGSAMPATPFERSAISVNARRCFQAASIASERLGLTPSAIREAREQALLDHNQRLRRTRGT